jgi:hypothetical protein
MRVASLLLVLFTAAAATTGCDPALQVPERPTESFVASGAKWMGTAPTARPASGPHCGCVGTLPVLRN